MLPLQKSLMYLRGKRYGLFEIRSTQKKLKEKKKVVTKF